MLSILVFTPPIKQFFLILHYGKQKVNIYYNFTFEWLWSILLLEQEGESYDDL